jgi:hypothetical protein
MRAPWDFFKGGREETEMPKSQVIPTVAEPKKGVEFIAVSYRRLVSRPGYENEAIEVTATVRPGETLDDVVLGCQAEVNARLGQARSLDEFERQVGELQFKQRQVERDIDELNRRREAALKILIGHGVEVSDLQLPF